jgi:IMP dehydrogenase
MRGALAKPSLASKKSRSFLNFPLCLTYLLQHSLIEMSLQCELYGGTKMNTTSAQSLPLHRPVILGKNNTLKEAAQAMEHNHVGSVIVTDGRGVLKGLFTDRDLGIALGLENVRPSDKLGKSTQTPLIYVSENATLPEIIGVMKHYGIRRVPVVRVQTNGRQRCLGIVTLDDLVRDKLITIQDENEILKSQLKKPKQLTPGGRVKNMFHSQDHKEHSLHLFLKNIEMETGLKGVEAKSLTVHVLTAIFHRIPAKASKNLLSQLPYELQVQLMSEIGPGDRAVTAKGFFSQIQKRYKKDAEEAAEILHNFWQGLEDSISAGEMRILSRQLPKEMMALFSGETAQRLS